METWMVTALWIIGPLAISATVIGYAALVLASHCDDQLERLRWEAQRDAMGKTVEDARRRP